MPKDSIYVLTYGSLRKGEYNYDSMGKPEYIRTQRLMGWKLYSFGSYPGAIYTGNIKDEITVDVLKLTPAQSKSIDRMEIGANYHVRMHCIEVGEEIVPAKIYEYNNNIEDDLLVDHGDWSVYLKEVAHA